MEVGDNLTVHASASDVWDLFWDFPRLGACLPGCESIEAIDDRRFRAHMVQKVGPFQVTMDLDMAVDEFVQGRRVVVTGGGKDKRGNTLKLNRLALELEPRSDAETGVSYAMDFNLFGRLATLGNAMVKRKAEEIRKEFSTRITAELEGSGG